MDLKGEQSSNISGRARILMLNDGNQLMKFFSNHIVTVTICK